MKDRQPIPLRPVVHLSNNEAAFCERERCPGFTTDAQGGPYCMPASEPSRTPRIGIPRNCPNGFQNQSQS